MKALFAALVFAFSVFALAPAQAAGGASPDEAKAMAMKAAEFLKSNGKDKAFAVFNDKANANFRDRDLYVFVVDNSGVTVSHGTNHALIGKSLLNIKDVDGKPFVQEMIAIKESGWVDYKWQNPQTKAVEPKTSYVVRVGDVVIGVGAYKG
ncbi:cache domain-containing protein [Desertibaculum subflavum]|uniref:cache domain-containing protein n=1 Tax=Desertibaculum subflavum TaxID=2268458 RepID=UPI000E66C1E3